MRTIKSLNCNNFIMVRKTVEITDEQAEWIEENAINFSKWVRQSLDEVVK